MNDIPNNLSKFTELIDFIKNDKHISFKKTIRHSNIDPYDLNIQLFVEAAIYSEKIFDFLYKNYYSDNLPGLLMQNPILDPYIKFNDNYIGHMVRLVCFGGYTEIMKLMLEDPRIDPTFDDHAPFRWACRKSQIEIIKLLLQDPRIDPTVRNNILIFRASRKHQVKVSVLLLEDKRVHSIIDNRSLFDYYSLEYGNTKIIKTLIKNTNLFFDREFSSFRLVKACEYGHAKLVKILLDLPNVDPSERDNLAIRVACTHGYTKVAEILLQDPRVDPSAQNNKALFKACVGGYVKIIKMLLADPRVDPSKQNNIVIKTACLYGHIEIVRLLLQYPSTRISSLITSACLENKTKIVKLLLEFIELDYDACVSLIDTCKNTNFRLKQKIIYILSNIKIFRVIALQNNNITKITDQVQKTKYRIIRVLTVLFSESFYEKSRLIDDIIYTIIKMIFDLDNTDLTQLNNFLRA